MDGKSKSGKEYSGEIGQALKTCTELPINSDFEPLTLGDGVINLDPEVIDDLSTDQYILYHLIIAARTGVINRKVVMRTIGPLCISRWLTTAARILKLYISKHNLSEEAARILKIIAQFIVSVYGPTWFQIKCLPWWINGPHHLLFHIKRIRFRVSDRNF